MYQPENPAHQKIVPDLTLKMDRKTFDDLSEGKIGRVSSVIKGKIQICGNIKTLIKFNTNVINKYFGKYNLAE